MHACKPQSFLSIIAIVLPVLVGCGDETPVTAEQPKQSALEFARSDSHGQVERRRATEAEVRAFVARAHGGSPPRQLGREELDGLLQQFGTTDDPTARRVLSAQFRAAVHAMPSQQERAEALRRYSAANVKPLTRQMPANTEATKF
jgi:hypothetical protein